MKGVHRFTALSQRFTTDRAAKGATHGKQVQINDVSPDSQVMDFTRAVVSFA